jgi:FdhD protein
MSQGEGDLAPVRPVDVTRVMGDSHARIVDAAATEEPLDIRLHGRSFAVIMRTPGADRALAAGFLLSERVIRSADDLGAVEHCRHPDHRQAHHVVDVFLVGDAAARVAQILEGRRQFVANSSCGVCGRSTIDELRRDITSVPLTWRVDVPFVRTMPVRLRETQSVFEETGGLHGAAIFSRDGRLLASAEDVGRHNAVDKAIGQLLLPDEGVRARLSLPVTTTDGPDLTLPAADVLAVSGRVAFEIVQKAWLAGISVIVAVSAPTTLAIELAREAGITLVGFARGDNLNIYTHPTRIDGM